MTEYKKKIASIIFLLLLMSIVPGVMTDVWDFVSPAKSLDEFEPYKTSLVAGSGVKNIDISPDGKFVVSSTLGIVNLWDTADLDLLYGYHVMNDESGATVKQREPYYNLVDIEFSKPGNYYLVGSNSNHPHYGGMTASHLTLYNMTHSIGVASRTFRTHQITDILIEDTAISPDETTYAACTEMTANPESCTITLWDIETGEVVNSITSDNYKATSITFTPDGKYLVASFDNSINPDRIVVFDLENEEIVRTIKERAVADLQFSDDGNILAAGSIYRSEVIVWDGNSYEELYRLRGLELSPDSTALSRDRKYIMAMDYSRLIVWDIESKRKIVSSRHRKIDFVDSFSSGTFSDDGKYVVIALVVKRGSEYTIQPDYNSGMVFIYDFEEILDAYYE
jgi:WD40 repeat protein